MVTLWMLLVVTGLVSASAAAQTGEREPSKSKPRPDRGWLGIFFSDPGKPANLLEVVPGSPAARAGLRPGDRLCVLGGQPVKSAGAAMRLLEAANSGDNLEMVVESRDSKRTLNIRLAAPPPVGPLPGPSKKTKPRVGMSTGRGAPPPASPAGETVMTIGLEELSIRVVAECLVPPSLRPLALALAAATSTG